MNAHTQEWLDYYHGMGIDPAPLPDDAQVLGLVNMEPLYITERDGRPHLHRHDSEGWGKGGCSVRIVPSHAISGGQTWALSWGHAPTDRLSLGAAESMLKILELAVPYVKALNLKLLRERREAAARRAIKARQERAEASRYHG